MENEIENQSAENQNDSTVEQPQDNTVKQEKVSEEDYKNAKKGLLGTLVIALVIGGAIVLIEVLEWDLIVTTIIVVIAIIAYLVVKLKK